MLNPLPQRTEFAWNFTHPPAYVPSLLHYSENLMQHACYVDTLCCLGKNDKQESLYMLGCVTVIQRTVFPSLVGGIHRHRTHLPSNRWARRCKPPQCVANSGAKLQHCTRVPPCVPVRKEEVTWPSQVVFHLELNHASVYDQEPACDLLVSVTT